MTPVTKDRIAIIGALGTARNIIEQIRDAIRNGYPDLEIAGIVIDKVEMNSIVEGIPVIGRTSDIPVLLSDKSLKFLFALYKPEKMKERFVLLQGYNIPRERFVNFIHPLSYCAGSAVLGSGNVVLSNSTIQSNAVIGDYNIFCSNVTVEHETVIGNGNFLAANSCIGSNVTIGDHCFIGLNSSVRENTVLGHNVFVGMHSLVLNNFENCTIAGVPAKRIRDTREH